MRLTSVLAMLSVLVAAGVQAKDAPKSIHVDCAKGESLNAALADGAAALMVEFSGVCAEDVVIGRGNVTLRGIAAGAKIAGAPSPAMAGPAIAIRGVTNVTLKDFAVQDDARRGVDVRFATAITLDGIVSDGNFSDGLLVSQGSSAFIRNSSFDDNGGDGIGVWQNSSATFEGTITLNGNNRVGLLLSSSSEGSVSFFGGQVTANDNTVCGVSLQLGSATLFAAANSVAEPSCRLTPQTVLSFAVTCPPKKDTDPSELLLRSRPTRLFPFSVIVPSKVALEFCHTPMPSPPLSSKLLLRMNADDPWLTSRPSLK